jgi:hypothetical protein
MPSPTKGTSLASPEIMNTHRQMFTTICAMSFALSRSASAEPDGELAPPHPRQGSVRAIVGVGGSDLSMAGRVGIEGEAWINDTFGVGGTVAAADNSTVFSGQERQMFTIEPQLAARVGGPWVQLVLTAGAGTGFGSRSSRTVEIVCFYECSPPTTVRQPSQMLGVVSAEAALLRYAGPIALSLGGRAETTTLGGAAYLVQLGAGWAIAP